MRLTLTVCAGCSHGAVAALTRSIAPALVDAAAVLPRAASLTVVSATCLRRCGRVEPLRLKAATPVAAEPTDLSAAVESYLRDRLRGPRPEG